MSNDTNEVLARLFKLWVMICKMIMDGTRDAGLVADYLQRIVDPSLPQIEPVYCWTKARGTIRFPVVSDGWTGPEWIEYCHKNGHRLSTQESFILNSPDFKPTPAGTTIQIEVLTGRIFSDSERHTDGVYLKAAQRNLIKPNADISCLIRKAITIDEIEKMGLVAIIGMSEPIVNQNGVLTRLGIGRASQNFWLGLYEGDGGGWTSVVGFAFEVPQQAA